MKVSVHTKLLGICLSATLLASLTFGQGLTGSINGTVTDGTGSAIPDADVAVTNIATSQTRQTKSDTSGDFVFTQLLPGTFRLTVSAKGFKRHEENTIIVTSTERVALKRIE